MQCVGRVQSEVDAVSGLVPKEFCRQVAAVQALIPTRDGDPDCVLVTTSGQLVESSRKKVLRTKQTGYKFVSSVHLVTSRSGRKFYFLLAGSEGVVFQGWSLKRSRVFASVESATLSDFWSVGSEQIKLVFSDSQPDLITDFEPRLTKEDGSEPEVAPCVNAALLYQLQLPRRGLAESLLHVEKLDQELSNFLNSNAPEKEAGQVKGLLAASLGKERIKRKKDQTDDQALYLGIEVVDKPTIWKGESLIFSLSIENKSKSQTIGKIHISPTSGCEPSVFYVLNREELGPGDTEIATIKLSIAPIMESLKRRRHESDRHLKLVFSFDTEDTQGLSRGFRVSLADVLDARKKEDDFHSEGRIVDALWPAKTISIKSSAVLTATSLSEIVTPILTSNCGLIRQNGNRFCDVQGQIFLVFIVPTGTPDEMKLRLRGPDAAIKLLLLRMRDKLPQNVDLVVAEEKTDDFGVHLLTALSNEVSTMAKFSRALQRDAIKESRSSGKKNEIGDDVKVSKEKYEDMLEELIELEHTTNKLFCKI